MRRLTPIAVDLIASALVLGFAVGLAFALGILSAAKILEALWVF